jgi:predicted dehydrogenase
MTRVKVFGAGSVGNHLTHACRRQGWSVTVCDVDPAALRRMREQIYPSRYGAWDPDVRLAAVDEAEKEPFDLVAVGTPPDTHVPIALRQLELAAPAVLLIEKPLGTPDLAGCIELERAAAATGTRVAVGYNHALTRNTSVAESWLAERPLGEILTLRAATREHWGGILRAHPWLPGPAASYLGFTARGGGALGEHSHAIHIWQHFAHATNQGRIAEVSAMLDVVEADGACYDRLAQLHVRTESGLVGTIVQDVITEPARKWLRIEGTRGFLEWEVNADPGHDAVRAGMRGEEPRELRIPKTRADDFQGEAEHLGALVAGRAGPSPISLERGLETMMVIAAAVRSHAERRTVRIDWERGFVPEALR